MALFSLPPLPYAYDALEPYFDEATMRLHHTKHHQGYVDKLNAALAGLKLPTTDLESLCKDKRYGAGITNHAGGHWNHSFLWESLSPQGGGKPSGGLLEAIQKQFGSFDSFQEQFHQKAMGVFGSGWTWLCSDKCGTLHLLSTPNQDNPLMVAVACNWAILLGVDVWEHAYYLKHQNRRADYLKDFFQVVHWPTIHRRFAAAVTCA